MIDLMLLVAVFSVGLIPGLLATVFILRRSRMYYSLWMNEKAGNYIMTKRLTELEGSSGGE